MKDMDPIIREMFEQECRSRSADPELPLAPRRPLKAAWAPIGTAAAAGLLLAVITVGLQFRPPNPMNRAIASVMPPAEQWNKAIVASSQFVISAFEGDEIRQ